MERRTPALHHYPPLCVAPRAHRWDRRMRSSWQSSLSLGAGSKVIFHYEQDLNLALAQNVMFRN